MICGESSHEVTCDPIATSFMVFGQPQGRDTCCQFRSSQHSDFREGYCSTSVHSLTHPGLVLDASITTTSGWSTFTFNATHKREETKVAGGDPLDTPAAKGEEIAGEAMEGDVDSKAGGPEAAELEDQGTS